MATRQEAIRAVDRALHLINRELDKQPDPLLAMVPREQKLVFRATLEEMADHLASGNLPPRDRRRTGLADEVIGGWAFTGLSEALVTADRAYRDVEEPGEEDA